MPPWKPVLAVTVVSAVGIFVLFGDYVSLQTSTQTDEFRGVLGDADARASAAAIMDMVFALAYATLGVIVFAAISNGVPRMIGTLAIVGAALADEVENVMVFLNIRSGIDLKQSSVDLMTTAGGIKWGLLIAAIVLALALTAHRWMEGRRA